MAAVWGDTFHGMDREPQPPQEPAGAIDLMIEQLDDRCLLSTAAGINVTGHLAGHALVAGTLLVGTLTTGHCMERGQASMLNRHCVKSQEVERPAGTIESRCDHRVRSHHRRRRRTRSTYNVNGSGMSRRRDRHRRRLQQRRPWAAALDPATKSSPATISPTTPPTPSPRPRSTARPSPD